MGNCRRIYFDQKNKQAKSYKEETRIQKVLEMERERESGPKLGVNDSARGTALISRWSAAATQDTIAEQRGSAQAEAHPQHKQKREKKKWTPRTVVG
jgi:hypothetical protein